MKEYIKYYNSVNNKLSYKNIKIIDDILKKISNYYEKNLENK
jgi:hypothetical protein